MDKSLNVCGEYSDETNWSNTEWLSKITGKKIIKVEIKDFDNGVGKISSTKLIDLKTDSGEEINIFAKVILESNKQASIRVGFSREAFFYTKFASRVENLKMPKCYYSYGDFVSGDKVVFLERLDGYLSSNFAFGQHHPQNQIPEFEEKTKDFKFSSKEVALDAFKNLAHLHFQFWEDKSVLKESWIRGADWMFGESKETWDRTINTVNLRWEKFLKDGMQGTPANQILDQELIDLISASIQKVDWDEWLKTKNPDVKNWTQTHGDAHPGNFLVRANPDSQNIETITLNFELTGIHFPVTDLANYLIFNTEPSDRKSFEFDILKQYHELLISLGVNEKNYSFEECKSGYVKYGFSRVWLITVMTVLFPVEVVKYFGRQFLAFAKDHGITTENVAMVFL